MFRSFLRHVPIGGVALAHFEEVRYGFFLDVEPHLAYGEMRAVLG